MAAFMAAAKQSREGRGKKKSISEINVEVEGDLLSLSVAVPTFSLGPLLVLLWISLQNISTA